MDWQELEQLSGAEMVAGTLQLRRGKEYIVLGTKVGTVFVTTPAGEALARELTQAHAHAEEVHDLPDPPKRGRPPKKHALHFDDEVEVGDRLDP